MIQAAKSGTGPESEDWIARWQRLARRIRVPLGFFAAALYLFELWRRAPLPAAVAWSLVLVLPGLWLRGYAAGYVKKNRELTSYRPLRPHPQSALPWLDAHCSRLCGSPA